MKITTNTELIRKEVMEDGTFYYTTVRRGVSYCANFSNTVGEWFVSSSRLSLGRHCGGGKYYKNLDDCKPFAALNALIKIGAI
jgi:hypothetical protein